MNGIPVEAIQRVVEDLMTEHDIADKEVIDSEKSSYWQKEYFMCGVQSGISSAINMINQVVKQYAPDTQIRSEENKD